MYEAVFKSVDDVLWKDAGCSTELDYIEQTSWVLFLKYLDDYEAEREQAAELDGKPYARIVDGEFRWREWAAPQTAAGKLDHNKIKTGDDLLEFVNAKLFPHLAGFKQSAPSADSVQYKIGEIFSETRNKLQSGFGLRDIIDKIDDLSFLSSANKHELSSLYEDKIKRMGNAGRNGGEYYTPRPLIKAIVKIISPRVGETVYDGACGGAGFLCEAYKHMKTPDTLAREHERLQKKTFYGVEKKSLAYVIGIMNCILHGIAAPNITHDNTLTTDLNDIQPSDQRDVVLSNPPFGGKERAEIQGNFPIKTGETAFLFLQHFIKKLKPGGRAGVVIKSTFLSNSDNASRALRKRLLEDCNLFAVLDVPQGAFSGASVKTVVLFFEKGRPSERVWYYQLNLNRKLGKTSELNDSDFADFLQRFPKREQTENSWSVDARAVGAPDYDLGVRNPNRAAPTDERSPAEIIAAIETLNAQANAALRNLKQLTT